MSKVWAEFIGWQDMGDGSIEPLFNIKGEHERLDSTVCKSTLKELGITDLRLAGGKSND